MSLNPVYYAVSFAKYSLIEAIRYWIRFAAPVATINTWKSSQTPENRTVYLETERNSRPCRYIFRSKSTLRFHTCNAAPNLWIDRTL